MIYVKVELQNLTRNLAGTWLKAITVCGRVPLDIIPISGDHRCYRHPRLRAGPSGEAAQGQCSAQTVPRTVHLGSGDQAKLAIGTRTIAK